MKVADLADIIKHVWGDVCLEHIVPITCALSTASYEEFRGFAEPKLLEINNIKLLMIMDSATDENVSFDQFLGSLYEMDAQNERHIGLTLGMVLPYRRGEVNLYYETKDFLKLVFG